ncbi:nitroreductase family protein [Vagococcus salmoninarum]|uniref:Nitroreductase n=1 Tax=Vagococcus salmoninarum TaxID=2739 RepID=A0A429ZVZ5_9ENTE|nr:nitroreductase family protein [Vagococcus salmoninarum]RST97947.1 nitroreductase [Vagococcus salmoninarum]
MTLSMTDGILNRRTAKRSMNNQVPLSLIYDLLEKASYAPYHKREPWLAKIITTSAEKDFLFQEVIKTLKSNGTIHDRATNDKFTKKMNRLIIEAPATIIFAREIISDNHRLNSDAIQGTAALIQNFSLLAWEAQLVGFWASSAFVMEPSLNLALGFPENYEIIANYRLGYRDPGAPQAKAQRQPVKAWASPLLPLD